MEITFDEAERSREKVKTSLTSAKEEVKGVKRNKSSGRKTN